MIAINFASRNYRFAARIQAGLLAGSVLLGVVMAGMIWSAVSLRANIAAMDRKVKDAQAADEQTQSLLRERDQLTKDLSAMSGLLESRKLSWTRLLTGIETVVPRGVALKKVEFNPKDRMLALEGIAQSPESLRTLVVGLEKSDSFKSPFLKHQSVDKGNISFNVVAVYQEDKNAGVARGK
ncbi:MAG TPA: PilN domain-containing protein [Nitrospirota bacterium]